VSPSTNDLVKAKGNASLVYSSDHGRHCPDCGKPLGQCLCGRKQSGKAAKDGVVRVGRETKGRKGKGVTIVTGVPLGSGELGDLAKQLKAKCGAGGTLKQGVIEIQGDHRDTVVRLLEEAGFSVKRAGR
jgi:translation initiation factor 1